MYSTAIAVAAIVHVHQFLLIIASPQLPCSNLLPVASNQWPNIKVTLNRIIDDEYVPGKNYTSKLYFGCCCIKGLHCIYICIYHFLVTLRVTRSNSPFKEFIIQGRSTVGSSSVGTFRTRPSRRQKYKPTCLHNVRYYKLQNYVML